MKTFEVQARQGDVLLTRLDKLPKGAKPAKPLQGEFVVAHSETGHHHVVPESGATLFESANDPFVAFLVVDNDAETPEGPGVELLHKRSFDTHESLRVPPGTYEVYRQRQEGIKGWERVAD